MISSRCDVRKQKRQGRQAPSSPWQLDLFVRVVPADGWKSRRGGDGGRGVAGDVLYIFFVEMVSKTPGAEDVTLKAVK